MTTNTFPFTLTPDEVSGFRRFYNDSHTQIAAALYIVDDCMRYNFVYFNDGGVYKKVYIVLPGDISISLGGRRYHSTLIFPSGSDLDGEFHKNPFRYVLKQFVYIPKKEM